MIDIDTKLGGCGVNKEDYIRFIVTAFPISLKVVH